MVKNKNGFTLVELLAVIVILAIILVIAVPQIMKTIDEARKWALSSNAKLLASSAEREYLTRKTIEDTDFNPANVAMECGEVAETTSDCTDCSIKFDANGKATVKLKGKYVCAGIREEAVVTEEECGLANNWLKLTTNHYWTISSEMKLSRVIINNDGGTDNGVVIILGSYASFATFTPDNIFEVYPSIYLSPNAKIILGYGSAGTSTTGEVGPYVIERMSPSA